MAEKKKKNPKFGGKRSLKDTSGDGKITFADTFLGDLLGLDGKVGTKGKAGLLKSLGGARRMKDGVETSKRPKARPKAVTTAAKTSAAEKNKATLASETRRQQSQVKKKSATTSAAEKNKATLASETRRQQSQVKKKSATGPVRRGDGTEAGTPRGDGRNTNPIPIKPKTPTKAEKKASQKRMMKRITLEDWKNLTKEEKIMRGLPKDNQEVFGLTGSLTLGAKRFTDAFKANRGGLAKKK